MEIIVHNYVADYLKINNPKSYKQFITENNLSRFDKPNLEFSSLEQILHDVYILKKLDKKAKLFSIMKDKVNCLKLETKKIFTDLTEFELNLIEFSSFYQEINIPSKTKKCNQCIQTENVDVDSVKVNFFDHKDLAQDVGKINNFIDSINKSKMVDSSLKEKNQELKGILSGFENTETMEKMAHALQKLPYINLDECNFTVPSHYEQMLNENERLLKNPLDVNWQFDNSKVEHFDFFNVTGKKRMSTIKGDLQCKYVKNYDNVGENVGSSGKMANDLNVPNYKIPISYIHCDETKNCTIFSNSKTAIQSNHPKNIKPNQPFISNQIVTSVEITHVEPALSPLSDNIG
ncbi:hypothetical protein A3Q56_01159 [Intoshia linei]|uniref:Uncharacterized protein n=1 Tax=Intoshia linei TaxID=1819745 RepID=A0A177B9U4_9BILA|nr:hypothetical protein A3Q56_01159 [Intoshia linei]